MENLADLFTSVAVKELVQVDLPGGSNQHEINGSRALQGFFSANQRTQAEVSWHYFADGQDPVRDEGWITFYDARERSVSRTGHSEWRLYYHGNFLRYALPGDVLILARARLDGGTARYFALVFQQDSSWLRAVKVLLGLDEVPTSLELVPEATLSSAALEFTRQRVLDELGLEIALPPAKTDEQIITDKFGWEFPTTAQMSTFARTLVDTDVAQADDTLVLWLTREEQLFRALERVLVQRQLEEGFNSVEDFISFSLSVQNRRKSRMGHALEHHLAALFDGNDVRYSRQARTEGKNKPDFLFPGLEQYQNQSYSSTRLTILASKSSCKDRWRQILTEAVRIHPKHLCTLEPGISTSQTDEMKQQQVRLVLPSSLLATYTSAQHQEILSVQQFISMVLARQRPYDHVRRTH